MGVVKAFIAVSRDGVIAAPEQAARAQADSGATTTGFEVDRDRIPSVVAELRRAVDALLLAEREAGEAGFLAPPGDDPVNRAAGEMGARLVEKYLSLNPPSPGQPRIDDRESARRDGAVRRRGRRSSPFVRQVRDS